MNKDTPATPKAPELPKVIPLAKSDGGEVVSGPPNADTTAPAILSLGSKLNARFLAWKEARQNIEDEWLKDLRQFNAQYENDVLSRIRSNGGQRSEVYIGLTRTKVMAAYSRLIDLLFQPGQQPFAVEPTPLPEMPGLAEFITKKAVTEILAAGGPGAVADPLLVAERMNELKVAFIAEAKVRAERMQRVVEDQMVEGDFERHCKDAILEMCLLGTGAIKIGTVRLCQDAHWTVDPEGVSTLVYMEKAYPEMQSVTVFDLYPDPFCTTMEDCDGIFRRHVLTKSQFRSLKQVPGFNKDLVDAMLITPGMGLYTEEQHERDRRNLAGTLNTSTTPVRYEVLEWWGPVDGQDLKDAGLKIKDEDLTREFQANIWLCGGQVLKAQLNPLPKYALPYKLVPYERSPHSIWGTGVPRMMRDSQMTMNAGVRIFIDNMAISSGPQVEVNTDLLAAGEDPTKLYPWRVWLREGGDAQQPMVRFYQPQNNAAILGSVIELFRRFADETTSLPSYTHGQQTSSLNATATGMSMLMGAANVNLKSVVKNIDDFLIEPAVEALYDWNMEFNDDPTIKGDLKVKARGSTALIQKEVQSQRILQFLSLTANPVLGQMVDLPVLLKDAAKAMDLDAERVVLAPSMKKMMAAQPQGAMNGDPNQGAGAGGAGTVAPPGVEGLVQPQVPAAGPMPQGLGNNGQLPV